MRSSVLRCRRALDDPQAQLDAERDARLVEVELRAVMGIDVDVAGGRAPSRK